MGIREFLKKNKTIRKIGKKINIDSQFRQDARDFNAFFEESAREKGDFRYSIMLLVHSLEKGMCFPDPRPFGFDKVKELMKLLHAYPEEKREEFEYKLGVSALNAWESFFASRGWTDDPVFAEAAGFLKEHPADPEIAAGWKEYRPAGSAADETAFAELLSSRCSVRDFQDRKIERKDMEFALRCFTETPTACNRQMCRVLYVEDPEKKELLNSVLIGIPGFNRKTVQFFVISYDLAAFAYSGERQQGLFNAGLCAMNFINGLHVKGIGSCCLQWSNKGVQDRKVRSALGLAESERIGVVIAAGYYLESNTVPCSVRRSPEDIFRTV